MVVAGVNSDSGHFDVHDGAGIAGAGISSFRGSTDTLGDSVMSLLAATVVELVSRRIGVGLFVLLPVLGVARVLWWHWTEVRGHGDLRLYGLVQYYPVLFIPLLAP
jgi:hypothetical protein